MSSALNAFDFNSKNQKMIEHKQNLSKFYNIYKLINCDSKTNLPLFLDLLNKSEKEDINYTMKSIFYIRNCRGGQGHKRLGRYGFVWMLLNHPNVLEKNLNSIVEFGRWDDFFYLFPFAVNLKEIEIIEKNYMTKIIKKEDIIRVQNKIVDFVINQLKQDRQNMLQNKSFSLSLCSKWFPTERGMLDKKYGIYFYIAKRMKMSCRKLRTKFITPLRRHLFLTESLMCKKLAFFINPREVFAKCFRKNMKTFSRLNYVTYKLITMNWKIHITSSFLLTLIEKTRNVSKRTNYINRIWNHVLAYFDSLNVNRKTICVVDVSPSMMIFPKAFNSALLIALIISNNSDLELKHKVINYSDNPVLTSIFENNIGDRLRYLYNLNWSYNLNTKKVLDIATENKAEKIIVISDRKTNFERERKGEIKIINWCINSSFIRKEKNVDNYVGFSNTMIMNILTENNISEAEYCFDKLNNINLLI